MRFVKKHKIFFDKNIFEDLKDRLWWACRMVGRFGLFILVIIIATLISAAFGQILTNFVSMVLYLLEN